MNLRYLAYLAVGLLPALVAHAADLSTADQDFVATVSQGGMFEVQAGQLGADHGNTQGIKDQGIRENHDHALVGDKLKAIASANGMKIADSLNPEFQKRIDNLNTLWGPAFDAEFLKQMKDIHAKDGAAFAQEAMSGSNKALRDFAAETRRIVRRHSGQLRALSRKHF